MIIYFTKMHALGNDFIILNHLDTPFTLDTHTIKKLSDRHTGIGFDQCLVIEPPTQSGIDFLYRIFNASGEEVGQCGNGARCLMQYLHQKNITTKKDIIVQTSTTTVSLHLTNDDHVTINFGQANWSPQALPMLEEATKDTYHLTIDSQTINFHAVNVGNPHILILTEDIQSAPVQSLGHKLCHHENFPEQTNVGFMQIIDKDNIQLRVFERGAGETLACGSGAVAAVAVMQKFYQGSNYVNVSLPGGTLLVSKDKTSENLFLTGNANFVYDGVTYPCT